MKIDTEVYKTNHEPTVECKMQMFPLDSAMIRSSDGIDANDADALLNLVFAIEVGQFEVVPKVLNDIPLKLIPGTWPSPCLAYKMSTNSCHFSKMSAISCHFRNVNKQLPIFKMPTISCHFTIGNKVNCL